MPNRSEGVNFQLLRVMQPFALFLMKKCEEECQIGWSLIASSGLRFERFDYRFGLGGTVMSYTVRVERWSPVDATPDSSHEIILDSLFVDML